MPAPWKKSYDQLRKHIQKQRHYFANKGPSKQGYGFSCGHAWMRELDWRKRRRIDAFELWCWKRFLRVPWTARRSNQSILKEINPEYSLKGLMLKLSKRLRAGGEEGDRGRDRWMASLTQWTRVWANSERQRKVEKPGVPQSMDCAESDMT